MGIIFVATCEDIVAERLRALLQQVPRKRNREQDVFDIPSILAEKKIQLNPIKVADFLRQKCAIRDVKPFRTEFRKREVKSLASKHYHRLEDTVRSGWIEFDEAWAIVLRFAANR